MSREAPTPLPAEPLPTGSRILHIGPSKTGTTALQLACWSARADLGRQGVDYIGNRRHTSLPARALTGTRAFDSEGTASPSMRWWTWLVSQIAASKAPRAIYSSEFLARADEVQARRVIRDVGPASQVVLTLRPLDVILASKWQQSVQAGSTRTLQDWLERLFADPFTNERSSPWRMHNHGLLVERWAAAAGVDRVSIVVANPDDHGFLFRAFEGLLGLRHGTLRPIGGGGENRSLTYPEVELIRQLNVQTQEAGIRRRVRNHLVYMGAATHAKRRPPDQDAPRVQLPAWAASAARELAEDSLETIRASGVRVIGDLDLLLPDPPAGPDDPEPDLRADPETAATIALGIAYGTGLQLGDRQPSSEGRPIPFVSSGELLRILADRARLGLIGAWRAARSLPDRLRLRVRRSRRGRPG